ncbi:hypothetical protein B0H14DRAFT_3489461 [Mycena olivaceomarginata]|nr:hypothetical protein B0H14DRAFT_3489461 [Mycena olivaceomarginata]
MHARRTPANADSCTAFHGCRRRAKPRHSYSRYSRARPPTREFVSCAPCAAAGVLTTCASIAAIFAPPAIRIAFISPPATLTMFLSSSGHVGARLVLASRKKTSVHAVCAVVHGKAIVLDFIDATAFDKYGEALCAHLDEIRHLGSRSTE